jgi:hypothetical protein
MGAVGCEDVIGGQTAYTVGGGCCVSEPSPSRTGRSHCHIRFITHDVMDLTTLADLRNQVEMLKDYRAKFPGATWPGRSNVPASRMWRRRRTCCVKIQ